MLKDINSLGKSQAPDVRSRAAASEAAAKRSAQTAAATPSPAKASEDVVKLSPQATALKSIEGKIAKEPEVNNDRVASIRKAIAEGKYPVDSQKLAQKLLDMDSLLGD